MEVSKPIVIVFGGAQFGNLRGSIPASTKEIRRYLGHFVKERKTSTYIIVLM
jgi:hypothetical protein